MLARVQWVHWTGEMESPWTSEPLVMADARDGGRTAYHDQSSWTTRHHRSTTEATRGALTSGGAPRSSLATAVTVGI